MKSKLPMIFSIISGVMLVAFVVECIMGYVRYDAMVTSAPYYASVLVYAICFILPAIIFFLIGRIIKKKTK